MKVHELMDALAKLPPDANVEVCVRESPDYAADLEITEVAGEVMGSNGEWVTLIAGELVSDHG